MSETRGSKLRAPVLVFAHLGSSVPRWLLPNMLEHRDHLGAEVVLVSDNSKVLKDADRRGILTHRYVASTLDRSMQDRATAEVTFRDGFWLESSRRFLAVAEVHRQIDAPILHVESDVVLLPSLNLGAFHELEKRIAFSDLGAGRSVGALVYLADPEASSALVQAFGQTDQFGVWSNDMTTLFSFKASNPGLVDSLPIAPASTSSILRRSASESVATTANNFEVFNGVFDAASIGQFLFGLDPRNHYGRRVLYSSPRDQLIDPSGVRFSTDGESLWFEEISGGNRVHVHTLHVHSKDRRVMSSESRPALLRQRCKESALKSGTRSEFVPWGLQTAVRGLAASRIKRMRRRLSRRSASTQAKRSM